VIFEGLLRLSYDMAMHSTLAWQEAYITCLRLPDKVLIDRLRRLDWQQFSDAIERRLRCFTAY